MLFLAFLCAGKWEQFVDDQSIDPSECGQKLKNSTIHNGYKNLYCFDVCYFMFMWSFGVVIAVIAVVQDSDYGIY